ncbi:SDR family NAD(P)-dependent oxidoreductase [Sandaracinobacteroides saxicola]|uniref:SDR family oxidoreductase n=1 Tax=Sandaracinobacteroides saxicola TaxID=2759707 RepID=A0A7G5IM51_9SPHN|nr:SDR family oxidoreductase [Sandaracinobacteroides saxicola]QMW24443.1 SDR family oxidoreductase [Sandaracinobacteroides saxicola]
MTRATYPSLAGRHVVVTGGGSGIGAVITEAFVAQGSRVTFLDVAEDESRALSATTGATFIRCDLTDPDAIAAAFAAVSPVDILVNNAANDDRHDIATVTPAYFDQRIAVNLKHHFFCAQAVAPAMKAAGRGVIINMGSISWRLALPGLAIYETAKAGIEGLTRALARELGGDGIRVTCVVPGGVRTPRQLALWHDPAGEAALLEKQCLKFRLDPPDIAAMVLFLASDDARGCTGQSYVVDAGWS